MLPINLRVVLLQPHEPQNHLILAEICYFGCHLLMVILIGNSNIHAVGDVTSGVLSAIDVENGDSIA